MIGTRLNGVERPSIGSGLYRVVQEGPIGNYRNAQEDTALISELRVCAKQKNLHRASILHVDILKKGLLQKNIFVGSTLLNMYARCGAFSKAREVFGELQVRDQVSWSVLITGYAEYGHAKEALDCFECMRREGFSADGITFASILKACLSVKALDLGKEVHAEIMKAGLLQKDMLLGTVLVDMYAKCGLLEKAQEVFNEMQDRDVITWNVLITGYTQERHFKEALRCFEQMQREGMSPSAVTLVCILKVVTSIGAVDKGTEIHSMIVRDRLLTSNIVVTTALVDMYVRCSVPEKAQEVVEKLAIQNVAPWNAVLTGLVQYGHAEEALQCFEQMLCKGICASDNTFVSIFKACGCIGAFKKGEELHTRILREGLIGNNIVVGTTLLDMYIKCGGLEKAQEVFDELPIRDVVSWTALITGYCQLGKHGVAFELYSKMLDACIAPNLVTFTVLLNVCSHVGDVEKGHMYFGSMCNEYGITPIAEHYSCMVDLYGRAGHFDKVLNIIKMLPSNDHFPLWTALLAACMKWRNVRLGRFAFDHIIRIDAKQIGSYVCMSNIYVTASMHEDANDIEALRVKNEVWD